MLRYLFAGSDSGGERAAAIDSLLGTAKLNCVDPAAWRRYVLTLIADHPFNYIDDFLSWTCAVQRAAPCSYSAFHQSYHIIGQCARTLNMGLN